MKRAIRSARPGLVWTGVVLLSLIAAARSTIAAQLNEATITRLVNDVQLRSGQEAARSAVVNESVPDGAVLQTGMGSRTELTFADQTLARLSANTIFSVNKGTRNLDLADGTALMRVPKGVGAKISTAAVTAAITGTTVIVEYHSHAYIKFISLEGTARLYLKGRWGESVLVRPGQMLITNPDAKGGLPDPVDVDLERLLKTSLLIIDFPPLGRQNLIAKESEKQQRAKSKRTLIDTNLVIFGKGTLVSLTNPAQPNAAAPAAVASSESRSAAILSSTDLGTIQTPPNPQSTPNRLPAGSYAADNPR